MFKQLIAVYAYNINDLLVNNYSNGVFKLNHTHNFAVASSCVITSSPP